MKLWIARGNDNALYLFDSKPTMVEIFDATWMWMCYNGGAMRISADMFPEVTFENSPMEVELKLIEKCVSK